MVEQSVLNAPSLTRYQFERIGYFCVDPDSASDKVRFCYYIKYYSLVLIVALQLVFNSTVPLKESPSNPTPLGKLELS